MFVSTWTCCARATARRCCSTPVCAPANRSWSTTPTRPEPTARATSNRRAAGLRITGFYFQSEIAAALARNAARTGTRRIPDAGVRAVHAKLEMPAVDEGFDQLFYVSLTDDAFRIEEWRDEV